MRRFRFCARRLRIKVVFPEPRKPVMIVTGKVKGRVKESNVRCSYPRHKLMGSVMVAASAAWYGVVCVEVK